MDDLALVLMQLPVAAGLFDTDGRVLCANERMGAYVRARSPSRDVERRARWRAVADDGQFVASEDWPDALALRGRPAESRDFLHTLDDGGEVWLRVSANPFRDEAGGLMGAVLTIEDVDARRRAEQGLRESEERFSRFMQHLPGLAWIKDLQGRYVFANEAATKAFGATWDGIKGRTDEEIFPPETAQQLGRTTCAPSRPTPGTRPSRRSRTRATTCTSRSSASSRSAARRAMRG